MSTPTEPGFWWHRDTDDSCGEAFEWKVLQVERRGATLYVVDSIVTAKEWKGEWGPRISDPDETRETDEAIKRSIQAAHDFTRDKLAERFLVGILASGYNRIQQADEPEKYVALAYRYADAMIEERKKRQ